MNNDLAGWYNSIPPISRYWFTAAIVGPLALRLGVISGETVILNTDLFWGSFHIWRPFTALFVYGLGFPYLTKLYFLYNYSTRLEKDHFAGKPADMAYMMIVIFMTTIIIGLLMSMPVLFIPPIIACIYVWCNLYKDVIVSFFFGLKFKAIYLPWILMVFGLIVANDGFNELLGIFIGHTYYFLKFRYPTEFGGPNLLETPQWLLNIFPNERASGGFGTAPPRRAQTENQPRGRWFTGAGNRLGD